MLYPCKSFIRFTDFANNMFQAIPKNGETSLSVLDNRAATYTKLRDLRAALKDGHRMIRQDKTDSVVCQALP